MSLYDFANGDPVNQFDPDGRFGKGVVDGWKGRIDSNDPNSAAFRWGMIFGGVFDGLVHAPGDVPGYWENAIVNPYAPGSDIIAAIEGAGGGFQSNVIDPFGTGAGLAIYDNVPGSVTVAGAYGYGGYISLGRDSDGRVSLIGAFGLGLGAKFEVSTNSPTLPNIQGTAPYIGVDTQGGTHVGAIDIGGGFGVYSSGDWQGNHVTVVTANGAVDVKGTPLSFGGEGRGVMSGNTNTGTLNAKFETEGVGSAGVGAFLFSGAQAGVVFGP